MLLLVTWFFINEICGCSKKNFNKENVLNCILWTLQQPTYSDFCTESFPLLLSIRSKLIDADIYYVQYVYSWTDQLIWAGASITAELMAVVRRTSPSSRSPNRKRSKKWRERNSVFDCKIKNNILVILCLGRKEVINKVRKHVTKESSLLKIEL
jgi:hypothetical protein